MVKKLELYTCILNKSVIKINSKYLISIKVYRIKYDQSINLKIDIKF